MDDLDVIRLAVAVIITRKIVTRAGMKVEENFGKGCGSV